MDPPGERMQPRTVKCSPKRILDTTNIVSVTVLVTFDAKFFIAHVFYCGETSSVLNSLPVGDPCHSYTMFLRLAQDCAKWQFDRSSRFATVHQRHRGISRTVLCIGRRKITVHLTGRGQPTRISHHLLKIHAPPLNLEQNAITKCLKVLI